MRNLFFIALFAIVALLSPELAHAASTINPSNGNAWDLYVFGNGRVIYDVLQSVKLLIVPESGDNNYRSLMILIAVIGFVVLAIQAGFDPAKNLTRMFGYIIMVWAVSYATISLRANINIIDKIGSSGSSATGVGNGYYAAVTGVPFLVGVPAALISQIGNYFTTGIEKNFNFPSELKIGASSVGQFNLFAKMIQESNQYVFTNSALRNSWRAYIADCTIPAMANGSFQGRAGPGDGVVVTGVDALIGSSNFIETMASAKHNAIMTKHFPTVVNGSAVTEYMNAGTRAALTEGQSSGMQDKFIGSQGLLVSCADAYDTLKAETEGEAAAMASASAEAWNKTGTQVTLEQAHGALISAAGMGGANLASKFGSPSTFIQQQAMIGLMNGSYAQAAAQTGNNEALTASLLAQAEQSQKSSWSAAFNVFNNMMGYIYTILQAFIFAISPLIIVAMLIPGMGKGIVTNYTQILVWLTLWLPMLAVINYLITLFGAEQVGSIWAQSGGPTLGNRAIISEKTNDLIIAAQFLGTMTPLLTWGIVKGALAFTEFIQSGVGSSFANSAGANAASGNLSMSSIGMNSTNMNNYSTAFASSVGFKSTTGYMGGGAMDITQAAGGTNTTANGGAVSDQAALKASVSESLSRNQAVGSALQSMLDKGTSFEEASRSVASTSGEAGVSALRAVAQAHGVNTNTGRSAGAGSSSKDEHTDATKAGTSDKGLTSYGVGVGGGGGVLGFKLGANADHKQVVEKGSSDDAGRNRGAGESQQHGRNVGSTGSEGTTYAATTAAQSGNSAKVGKEGSQSYSDSEKASISRAISANEALGQQLQSVLDATNSRSFNNATDMAAFNQLQGEYAAVQARIASGLDAAGISSTLGAGAGAPGASAISDLTARANALGGADSNLSPGAGAVGRAATAANAQAMLNHGSEAVSESLPQVSNQNPGSFVTASNPEAPLSEQARDSMAATERAILVDQIKYGESLRTKQQVANGQ